MPASEGATLASSLLHHNPHRSTAASVSAAAASSSNAASSVSARHSHTASASQDGLDTHSTDTLRDHGTAQLLPLPTIIGTDDDGAGDTYPLARALIDAGLSPQAQLAVLEAEDIPDVVVDIIRAKSSTRPEASAAKAAARAQCRQLVTVARRVVAEAEAEAERQRRAAADAAAAAELEQRRTADVARRGALAVIGRCVAGYAWLQVAGGYVCAGGSHSLTDAQLDAYIASREGGRRGQTR
jgi:hypothetical protein